MTGKHLEQLIGVAGQILAGKLRTGNSGFFRQRDITHPVHTVAGDTIPGRQGLQVAVFVVLTQAIGTDLIVLFPVASFAVNAPVEVPEGDLPVSGNGLLNGVYIIIALGCCCLRQPGLSLDLRRRTLVCGKSRQQK